MTCRRVNTMWPEIELGFLYFGTCTDSLGAGLFVLGVAQVFSSFGTERQGGLLA